MNLQNIKTITYTGACMLFFSAMSFAQQGTITINQDKEIDALMSIKKNMIDSENGSDRYRIQIYSGNRSGAEKAQSSFKNSTVGLSSKLVYETPNYKVWVGSFSKKLEADRALIKVNNKFPSAFIFKPKKDKK